MTDTFAETGITWSGLSHGKDCRTLEAQCVYCIQLSREAGLLYSAEGGGTVCSTQLSKDTGLANRSRSSLQAINTQEDTAPVDTLCTLSLELERGGMVFPLPWWIEGIGLLNMAVPISSTHTSTQGFIHSLQRYEKITLKSGKNAER